jgi:hypothetical protein
VIKSRLLRVIIINYLSWVTRYIFASAGYKLIKTRNIDQELSTWTNATQRRQIKVWGRIIKNRTLERKDVLSLREALNFCNTFSKITLCETGSSGGYNKEIINNILKDTTYIGLDQSFYSLLSGINSDSDFRCLNASAEYMPFKNKSINIVLDGATLIHVNDYEKALREYIRISRNYIILHSLTLYDGDKNLLLSKYAYGQKVLENIFSVNFLNEIIEENGIKILAKFTGENYNLNDLIGIPTTSETWVLGER